MGIESLPGNFLGTVIEYGVATGGFPGTPGTPFDAQDFGIITTSSTLTPLYFIPGTFFSTAGGGTGGSGGSAPAPPPVGDGGFYRDPKT